MPCLVAATKTRPSKLACEMMGRLGGARGPPVLKFSRISSSFGVNSPISCLGVLGVALDNGFFVNSVVPLIPNSPVDCDIPSKL